MAKVTITRIPVSAMQTNRGDSGFSQLVGGDLGNDFTAGDGFESLLGTVSQAISDDAGFLPALDGFLARMSFTPGTFAATGLNPILSLWGSVISLGNSLIDNYNKSVSGGVPVPPPPATTPVVISRPVVTPPVVSHLPTVTGEWGGEPPWFDPTNPDTWRDATGVGSLVPDIPWRPDVQ
jgi:hypothetical protein